MKTYAAIKAEIEKLERQAESARRTEVSGVVARIKEAIEAYGLTAQDLGLSRSTQVRTAHDKGAKNEVARRATAGVPKFRDPASGKTWTGRGRPPAWVAAIADRDSLLVAAPSRAAAGDRSGMKHPGGSKRASQGRKVPGKKTGKQPGNSAAVQIESGATSS